MNKKQFDLLIKSFGCFIPEYKFLINRKYRFDYANINLKIAIEFEGGIFTKGRHSRPLGYSSDCMKYNLAQLEGWIVLRFTCIDKPDFIISIIKKAIKIKSF